MTPASKDSPLDAGAFRPRFPWFGGDLQTLRNFLLRPRHDLDPWPAERVELAMRDGSGDRLAASLHRSGAASAPLVVLIHGLTGCEDSTYLRASAAFWLARGRDVVRLNLRGAGPSRPLCAEQYHAGRSGDLRDALLALAVRPGLDLEAGLYLVGYSLGANMLLRFLAQEAEAFPVVGAVSVSAPIDLKATQRRLMQPRNWVYHRYLLNNMRREALAAPRGLSAEQRAAIRSADSVFAYDDQVVAPRNGFAGADDYYRRCSGLRFLPAIKTPTLLLHAGDDPWIPSAPYETFDWESCPALWPLLCGTGGHVGFHGRGRHAAWHDLAAEAFFDRLQD
ncbi:alpha/beta fold hydrolase [Pelagibius sp. CAU 1746]|uniref:YheT family hydrolase n=1 Tax=Pelagibius sp. CAU 1746 TaxID=3140370 RepID=UPI00325BD229